MRQVLKKHISNPELFKAQLFNWGATFDEVIWLDSNNYHQLYSRYDAVLAVDAFTSFRTDHYDAFEGLRSYQESTKDWLFGYLSYDLKNDVEDLVSENYDGLRFPDLYVFQPKKLLLLKEKEHWPAVMLILLGVAFMRLSSSQ